MENLLVTGVAKGVGRYLHGNLGGLGLTRQNSSGLLGQLERSGGVDTIIHCAFNSAKSVPQTELCGYHSDNVLLTGRLLALPHRRFVFFSSVDVYPKDGALKWETDQLSAGENSTPYSLTKLISEAMVMRESPDWLVLRPVQMLGAPRRRNVLTRILQGDLSPLPLTSDSVLNCVLYSDVLEFVRAALSRGLSGVYNLAAGANATLAEIAGAFGRQVCWGEHFYDIGLVSNEKAAGVVPAFRRTTLENIRLHWSQDAEL